MARLRFVHAADLHLDSPFKGIRDLAPQHVAETLHRLESAGIRSFISHGNHDPLNGWEARLALPLGCHRFGAEVEGAPVFSEEPERAVVYGISYPQREVRENLVPRFSNIQPGGFTIGLLHANVDSNPDHDSYSP